MSKFVLALDQGTTSSRAILFDHEANIVSLDQQEFPQLLPQPGEVEHDPNDIWSSQLATAQNAINKASANASEIAALESPINARQPFCGIAQQVNRLTKQLFGRVE